MADRDDQGGTVVPRRAALGWTGRAIGGVLGGGLLMWGSHAARAVTVAGGSPSALPVRGRPAYYVDQVLPAPPRDAIALTIDDGPDPLWTPQVLDLLRRHGIRATYSLIGSSVERRPDLVRRIHGEGHAICNHSMNHPQPFANRSHRAIVREIADAQSAITDACGTHAALFRSPGGDWSPDVLETAAAHDLLALDWDIDPRDWSRPGVDYIRRHLLAARPNDILLCHDGGGDRSETLAALGTVLPELLSRGLRFVTL